MIFAGPGERIELSHRAEDRALFARGAVKAALWAFDRKPGYYTMADVLGLVRPLTRSPSLTGDQNDMNRLLVLVRHGQSEWNLKNLFTGWKDPGLTDLGVEEARKAGRRLKAQGVTFDIAYTSALSRAQRTCELILEEIGQPGLETIRDQA